jgi:hypothetical protein
MGAPVPAEDLPDNMVPADDLPDTAYNGLIPNADTAVAAPPRAMSDYESQNVAARRGEVNSPDTPLQALKGAGEGAWNNTAGGMLAATGGFVAHVGALLATQDPDAAKAVRDAVSSAFTIDPTTDTGKQLTEAPGEVIKAALKATHAPEAAAAVEKAARLAFGDTAVESAKAGMEMAGEAAMAIPGAAGLSGLGRAAARSLPDMSGGGIPADTEFNAAGVAGKGAAAPLPPTTAPTTTGPFTSADMRSKTPPEQPAASAAEAGSAPVAPPAAAPPAAPAARPGITHTVDPDTGEHVIKSPHGVSYGDTMRNGDIQLWRNDTDPAHQGEGEGTARLATAADAAHAQGTNLVSSTSESPHGVDSYHALQREGYDVKVHPGAEHNPETGNYTLPPGTNPNDSIFTVGPKTAAADALDLSKPLSGPPSTDAANKILGPIAGETAPGVTPGFAERRAAKSAADEIQRTQPERLARREAAPVTADDLNLGTAGADARDKPPIAETPPVASEAGRGAVPTAAPASADHAATVLNGPVGSRFTLPSEEGAAQATLHTPEEAGATAALIKKTLPQLNEVRTGAINNDWSASGQVFNQAKVKNAVGERARELIGNQDQAMRTEVAQMAGNASHDPLTETARGQELNDAFDAAHSHFDQHVATDYTEGQEAGKQFPAKTDNFTRVMAPAGADKMPSVFMTADGKHLYEATQSHARVLGLDKPGTPGVTADRLDALRQFVNEQKSPSTWRQAKLINDALDKDLQASMPSNAFERGRRNRTAKAAILERNDTVAKFAPPKDGIESNRSVQPGAAMSKLAGQSTSVGQFHDVFKALTDTADHLEKIGDHAAAEDVRTKAAAAHNAMSDHFAANALKAGQKIERGWDQKSFAAYLRDHEAKMADLNSSRADGGAATMQKWEDLNKVGNALKMDRQYPGAAAQWANITTKGVRGYAAGAADKTLTALGALKGGPVGAVLGESAGRRAASFIAGSPETRALREFEAEHVTKLDDYKPGGEPPPAGGEPPAAPPAAPQGGPFNAPRHPGGGPGQSQRGGPKFEGSNPYNNAQPKKDIWNTERTQNDRRVGGPFNASPARGKVSGGNPYDNTPTPPGATPRAAAERTNPYNNTPDKADVWNTERKQNDRSNPGGPFNASPQRIRLPGRQGGAISMGGDIRYPNGRAPEEPAPKVGKKLAKGDAGATVNIGLDSATLGHVKPEDALAALQNHPNMDVSGHYVQQSGSEPTLVARLSRPLSDQEAHDVSGHLGQEAIAQKTAAGGKLHGPGPWAQQPFNNKYFIDHDAAKATAAAAKKKSEGGTPSFFGAGARLKAKKLKAGNITLPNEDEVPF